MKKFVMVFAIILVVSLLCMTVVACDDNNNSQGPNEYEVAKYTVTFVTNGDFVLTNSVLKDIPAGTKITAPKDKDGRDIIPVKKGYTFQFWSADGTTPFDFDAQTITKNTTLTAIYTNNVYKHNTVLTAKLIYNEDGTYTVDENGYSTEQATLSVAELDPATTSIKSTYAGSTTYLACPTVTQENDSFCFWYYIDENGKPVQFTKWATSGATSVMMLSKYYFTHELTLYPMYYSNLPKVQIVYRDSKTETVFNTQDIFYAITDSIPVEDCILQPTRAGYSFAEWYYIVKDSDGVEKEYTFNFAQDGVSATDLLSAAMLTDNFTNGTLRLYARWKREISLASVSDFNNLSAILNVENPTSEQKEEINEVLNANIYVSSIDFGGAQISPLFDKYTFVGTIDGGTYNANHDLTAVAVLSNAVVSATQNVSIFGNISGKLSNVNCENITLSPQTEGDYFQNTVYVGTLASANGGEIFNCHVTNTIFNLDGGRTVVFGGICAVNAGTNGINTKGYIHDCSVDIDAITFVGEGFIFGGIAAQSNASSRLVSNVANIVITSVTCKDDGLSSTGKPVLRIGGMVASSSATISRSTANVVINAIDSVGEAYIGGIVGQNNGALSLSQGNLSVCSASAPAKIGATLTQNAGVGGLVGTNEGTIINSLANANIYVCATNSNGLLALGGLVGNNYSEKKDTSTSQTQGVGCINKSYATGEIVFSTQDDVTGVNVYVGGIAGRNSQKKIAGVFAIVNISVNNSGTNNIGYLFGSMERSAVITSGWYSNQAVLSLNGETYNDGNFTIIQTGTNTDPALFEDVNWVIGSDSTLGWDVSIWNVREGHLPELK